MTVQNQLSVKVKNKFLLHLLGAIWVFPATILVWLFYILPLWLIWKDLEFKGWYEPFIAQFQLSNYKLEPWHARRWKDWYGVGLPCAFIYKDLETTADDIYSLKTCRHESRHCKQWFVFGIFFYLFYLIESIFQKMKGMDPYRDNRFEVDARAHE